MARYQVRSLKPDDFDALMSLEHTLFGGDDDGVLGPYYVRLCCDFFANTCFLVEVAGEPVGYLLSFVREREAYCTTLAILPRYQGTRALVSLLRVFTAAVADQVDAVWFTVEEGNKAARALHAMLGAREVGVRPDFYGEGRPRIVSLIDKEAFVALKERFLRLGLADGSLMTRAVEARQARARVA